MWSVQARLGWWGDEPGRPWPGWGSRVRLALFVGLSGPAKNKNRAGQDCGAALPAPPRPPLTGQAFSPLPAGALQIESSEETDQGKYECVATNSAGVRYSSPANLYVRGRERRVHVEGRDLPIPLSCPPSLLGLTASGLPCTLQTQAGGPPTPVATGPRSSFACKWGWLNPPNPRAS